MNEEKLDRRQRRSREAIRKAFRELLSEKDLAQITVTEITRRADRNRKTFYLHYSSIEDLINEMLQDECANVVDALEETLRKSTQEISSRFYNTLGDVFIDNFSRNSEIIRHVDNQALINQLRPMLIKVITERDSLGLAKALGPYLEVFVAYFSSGILSLYNQWLELDSELPLEYLSELAVATVSGGVDALIKAAAELHIDELAREEK